MPHASGCFEAISSKQRVSVKGRPLPAVDVRYLVAQVDGQLSGGEIAGATGTRRPISDSHYLQLVAAKESLAEVDLTVLAFMALHCHHPDAHGHDGHEDPSQQRAQHGLPGSEVEQHRLRTAQAHQYREFRRLTARRTDLMPTSIRA